MFKKKSTYSFISVFMAVLMIVLSVVSPVGALSETLTTEEVTLKPSVNPEDKIDSALKEKMAEASPDEKIPVAIWLEDIDKEELETTVEQTCGIAKADVSVKQSDISLDTELYQAIDSQNESVLRSYVDEKIDASKEQREMKKLYNSTLRSVASDFYTEHNESIVSTTQIQTNDIIFLSKLTPFMLAEVDAAKIAELSTNESVMSIGYYNDEVGTPPSSESDEGFSENMAAMNIDKSIERFGLTGYGVNVLLIDHEFVRPEYDNYSDIPYPENIMNVCNQGCYVTTNTSVLPATNGEKHGNLVATELQKVVPDVNIYSTHIHSYSDIEWAIEHRYIDIINASINQGVALYDDLYVAKWYDALISTYGIPAMIAAGNFVLTYTTWVNSPSSGYNSIAVGAYESTINEMYNFRYNPIDVDNVVKYKPDIISAAGSTSVATPYVTGIVAMITELDSSIAGNPALVKAILMASCHNKAIRDKLDSDPQENMFDGLTLKQGAGKIDAYKALSIVLMGTYETGSIVSGTQKVNSLTFTSDNNVNISLAWLRSNVFPEDLGPIVNSDEHTTTLGTLHELSLRVDSNGSTVKSSNVTNSGKQLVYFSATQNSQCDVYITKTTSSQERVYYAYAWSTSFQKDLTNAQLNGKFAKNQQLSVTAQCNDETTAGVNTLNYQWQSSADGETWSNISGATSNTYTLTNQEFLKYVRCKVTPKSTSGILPYPFVADSDLKVIIYGDSDLSGAVNTKDATAVQKYVAGMIDLSDDQKRAADVDGDGDVDTNDATYIQKYVASQITVFPVE